MRRALVRGNFAADWRDTQGVETPRAHFDKAPRGQVTFVLAQWQTRPRLPFSRESDRSSWCVAARVPGPRGEGERTVGKRRAAGVADTGLSLGG